MVGENRWLHGISCRTAEIVRNTADGHGNKKSIIHLRRGKISDFQFSGFNGVSDDTFDISTGKIFVDAEGKTTAGTMANNGEISKTMDGLTAVSVSIPAGYTTGGTVSLSGEIEEALAAI